jgi:serine phosphatase RsbU (regulator of sigma subunit)
MNNDDGGAEPATFAGAGAPALLSTFDGDPPGMTTGLSELGRQQAEHERLWQIVERINHGVGIEEILDFVYDEFRDLVPFNRLSYAVVENATGLVVARWTRSDGEASRIVAGYSQPLEHSSLADVFRTGRARIINDLVAYLHERPHSEGTRKLVDDGMRASLTCPLVAGGRPVGFLFFDSRTAGSYSAQHLEPFQQVAGVVSGLLERGRMFSELAAQKAVIEEQGRRREEEYRRGQQELELARKVQRALIPAGLPPCEHLSLSMVYEPAAKIGGDLLDCIRLSDGSALLYVADAMGHGVPAALLMAVVRTAFHGALARLPRTGKPSPAALLGEVNRTLVELLGQNYVTAVCVRIDSQTDSMTLSLAGHPPALVRRSFAADVTVIPARGIPLGISADTSYTDVVEVFEPGDTLVLYTDGVTEAPAPDGSFFGIAGLMRALRGWRGGSVDGLADRLRRHLARHSGSAGLDDDLTILAVQATPYA